MSALTRIFNNQIYNATIIASQKIAPGTITGSLFSSNVTVPGDLLIAGNLFVLGSSAYTTIASTNTYVNDPLVVLNNGFSGTNTRDMGLVFNRGTDQNQAIIWSEVFDEFRLIATNETGTTYGNINAAGLARLSIGSLTVPGQANIGSAVISGAISGTSLNVSGNVLASTVGASYVTASTATFGNISAVSFGNTGATFSGASLNVSGNVLASTVGASYVTASTATFGNVAAGIVGNVGTQFNGASINLSGNVLAAEGVLNGLTVNGNGTVTGYLNVTGNVVASNVVAQYFVGNGALLTGLAFYSNIQTKAYTETMGFTNYSNVNVKAYTETMGFTNYSNVNVASYLSTATINTTGNVLAAAGTFNALTVNGNESVTGYLNVTGNVLAAAGTYNALTVNGLINTSGNVLATAGTFNALTVNGNETVTGFLNVTGNVLGATATFSSILSNGVINTTSNVLATGGVFNSLQVNGNETVTGYLNVTGNILGDTGTLNILGVSNTLWANSSAATTTQGTGALIVPNGGISIGGAANIAGSITSGGVAQFNSNVFVGGIFDITNTTNATDASGSTGALRLNGGASIEKDLWVGGNIYASNIFGVTQQTITVQDPLLYLTASNTFPYTYDIGIYSQFTGPDPVTGTGNAYQHSGVVRDSNDYTWKFFSNVRAEPTGTVPFDSDTIYDPVLAGNLRLTYTQAATSTTTGALQVAGGAGIGGTLVAAQLNSTGNVLGQAGTFNALTVNGGITSTGYFNTSGNISTAQLNAGQINTTGNVLATAGVFNAVTVNGNETVTGYLNVTGNVLASTVGASFLTASTAAVGNITAVNFGNAGATYTGAGINLSGNVLAASGIYNYLDVNGNVDLGLAGAVSGSWVNVIGNITQTSSGGAVYFNTTGNVSAAVGVFGSINSTGYINTSGNISTAQLNAGQINTTGNVLASTVGASFLSASTAAVGNISAVTIGNAGATVTGTTGTFGAVNSGFIGNTGTAFTGASINLSGNVLASSILTNFLTADDVVFGNVSASVFGNVGAVFTGASINLTGNVLASTVGASYVTASTAAVGNISAVTIGNAGATVTGTTAAFSGNVIGGLAQFAAINSTPIGNASASTGAFTTLSASQGIWANSTTASTSTTTGAIVVAGGVGIAGNVRAGGGAVFNSSQTADPFQVRGVATTSLIYADTANGGVVIGGSNTAAPLGMTLKVNGTDSMLLPIGSTAQRPGSSGNVDIAGMIRYNTTIQDIEYYNGATWTQPGSGATAAISDRQFAGNVAGGFGNVDGTNTVFTIQSNSTTAGTVVSINGVVQFPTLAYAVSGTTLTFTEPPAPDDVIDVRVLSLASTVTSITSDTGYNQFIASNSALEFWSGAGTTTKQMQINTVGDVEFLTGGKTTYTQPVINIAANNTPYVISTWSQTAFVTAKYVISAKRDNTNYQSMEALVTTDQAGNAYITTYAVLNNGVDMGGLTANVVGGNVQVYWTTTTNITNANVKAMGTFIV